MNENVDRYNWIKSCAISEAQADEVGLWMLMAWVEDELQPVDEQHLRHLTLLLLRDLLESGDLVAGTYPPGENGVKPWSLTTEEAIARINVEWDQLGRRPTIGEIVTLIASPDKQSA